MSKTETQNISVLLSAYACEPNRGSEPGVGWNMAKTMSSKVKLSVLTRANNREVIEVSGDEWVKNVEWVYYDLPYWLRFWKKGQRGSQIYYILWQFGAFFHMLATGFRKRFDLIHHVTFGRYWVPSMFAFLSNPLVFGPVGGGEYAPNGLRAFLSPKLRRFEILKRFVVGAMTWNPLGYLALRKTSLCLSATPQTTAALEKIGIQRIELLPQSGISMDELEAAAHIVSESKSSIDHDDFIVCCASRLIPWKGVDLAIEAFAAARHRLPERSKLLIIGEGSEMKRLKLLAKEKCENGDVEFLGRLATVEEMHKTVAASDCLIHPAVSEAFGQVCLEAMSLGTPVVCWNWAGPGMVVGGTGGFTVETEGKNGPVGNMADALASLAKMPCERRRELEAACVRRAGEQFGWEHLGNQITALYQTVLENSQNLNPSE
jgi:glycosyltransferase involved in cell wall biosynthesis